MKRKSNEALKSLLIRWRSQSAGLKNATASLTEQAQGFEIVRIMQEKMKTLRSLNRIANRLKGTSPEMKLVRVLGEWKIKKSRFKEGTRRLGQVFLRQLSRSVNSSFHGMKLNRAADRLESAKEEQTKRQKA